MNSGYWDGEVEYCVVLCLMPVMCTVLLRNALDLVYLCTCVLVVPCLEIHQAPHHSHLRHIQFQWHIVMGVHTLDGCK